MTTFPLVLALLAMPQNAPQTLDPAAPPKPQAVAAPTESGKVRQASEDEAFQIGKELRCPVCQGMPIAESPADMAQDMMKRVRELHKQGKSRDEILNYFVASYGEFVLLRPKAEGTNLLVWILPPVCLGLGIFMLLQYLKKSKEAPKQKPSGDSPEGDDIDAFIEAVRDEVRS